MSGSSNCDVCLSKSGLNQTAVTFCTSCAKKYCKAHQQSHDDIHETHTKIGIEEHLSRETNGINYCSEHSNEPYRLGCSACLNIYCVQCVPQAGTCPSGQSASGVHELIDLDEMVSDLAKDVDKLKTELVAKKDKLFAWSQRKSDVLSDYDAKTEEMIQMIHETKAGQLEAIGLKYETLETDFIARRAQGKGSVGRFMEDVVGRQLSELSSSLLTADRQEPYRSQVEMVRGYKDVKTQFQRLNKVEIPTLKLKNMVSPNKKDMNRDIEAEMVPVAMVIEIEQGLTTSRLAPESLGLMDSVHLSARCVSVCQYQGQTYVGLKNGNVVRIDGKRKLTESVISNLGSYVEGLAVCEQGIYTLVCTEDRDENRYIVYRHSLGGELITQWDHTDNPDFYNQLAVVGDTLVIPDRLNQRLTIYSLTGETLRHVACPLLSSYTVALCAVGTDSVVVVNYNSSQQVFRLNIFSSQVTWTSADIYKPQGIAYDGRGFLFVVSCARNSIVVLDANTGDTVTKLDEKSIDSRTNVHDLHISGTTIIVLRESDEQVLYYQLVN